MVLAVIIAAVVYVIPTFKPEIWPHRKINLGLDLQGGMHLVLEVDDPEGTYTDEAKADLLGEKQAFQVEEEPLCSARLHNLSAYRHQHQGP